jgi:hypothetical protein
MLNNGGPQFQQQPAILLRANIKGASLGDESEVVSHDERHHTV